MGSEDLMRVSAPTYILGGDLSPNSTGDTVLTRANAAGGANTWILLNEVAEVCSCVISAIAWIV